MKSYNQKFPLEICMETVTQLSADWTRLLYEEESMIQLSMSKRHIGRVQEDKNRMKIDFKGVLRRQKKLD